jgi:hypothetical protein
MTSTAVDPNGSTIPLEVAANASLADKQLFQALWQTTLTLSRQGIIGYFLPKNMATQMGDKVLEDIAKELRSAGCPRFMGLWLML